MTKYVVFSETGGFVGGITVGKKYEVFQGGMLSNRHIVDDDGDKRSAVLERCLERGWATYSKPKYLENK